MNSNNNIDLGFEAHQRGDYQLALNFYEQALLDSESDAEAWSLKGSVLSLLNSDSEAEISLRKAVALEPNVAGFWLNLADHYLRTERGFEAAQLILDNVPSDSPDRQVWQFLYQVGLKLENLEFAIVGLNRLLNLNFSFKALISLSQLMVKAAKFKEAITLLIKHKSRCLREFSYWHALCWLLNSQRSWIELKQYAEEWLNNFNDAQDAIRYLATANFETGLYHNALDLYEKYLVTEKLLSSDADVSLKIEEDLINYLNICISSLELRKAEETINKANTLKIDSPAVLNAQIQLAIFQGDLELAESKCNACLHQFPDFYPVYIHIARITPKSITAKQIEAIKNYVAEEHSDSDALAFVLGHYFHAKKEPENAWKWYSHANQLRAMRNAERGAAYQPVESETFADNIIELTQKLESVELTEIEGEAFEPIFILGMPRSGSTLLEGLLSRYPAVQKTGERIEFPNLIYRLVNENLDDGELTAKLLAFRQLFIKNSINGDERGSQTYFIDKNPSNYLTIGLIKAIFPKAKIINIKRTAVETIWSIYRHEFSHMWSFATSVEHIAHQYTLYERLMAFWKERYDDILNVDYEALVESPKSIIASVLASIDPEAVVFKESAEINEDLSAPLQNQEFTTLSAVQVRGEIKNLNGKAADYLPFMAAHLAKYPQYLSEND